MLYKRCFIFTPLADLLVTTEKREEWNEEKREAKKVHSVQLGIRLFIIIYFQLTLLTVPRIYLLTRGMWGRKEKEKKRNNKLISFAQTRLGRMDDYEIIEKE